MTLAVWFYLGMALWLLFGGYVGWTAPADGPHPRWVGWGGYLIPWLCVLACGWAIFGGPVK